MSISMKLWFLMFYMCSASRFSFFFFFFLKLGIVEGGLLRFISVFLEVWVCASYVREGRSRGGRR